MPRLNPRCKILRPLLRRLDTDIGLGLRLVTVTVVEILFGTRLLSAVAVRASEWRSRWSVNKAEAAATELDKASDCKIKVNAAIQLLANPPDLEAHEFRSRARGVGQV